MEEIAKWFLAVLGSAIILSIAFFGIGVVIVFEAIEPWIAWIGTGVLVLILSTIFRYTVCKDISIKRFLWWRKR